MNENRRPRVSAITPVGISNRTWPTAKNAFAANASALLSPASSRNSVLTPQMNDAANVVRRVRSRYVRWTVRAGLGTARGNVPGGAVLRLGDDPDRNPEAGPSLERGHQRSLPDGRIAREPADPLLVEHVELRGVLEGPVRPDHFLERRLLLVEERLEVGQAAPRLVLDRGAQDLAGLAVDRADRGDIDHPASLDSSAATDRHRGGVDDFRARAVAPASLRLADRARSSLVLGRDPEFTRRQRDPVPLELGHERRPDTRRPQLTLDSTLPERGLLEREDVLGQDLVVLDPVDLGDVDDLAAAVLEPGRVHDEVDRGGDLLANRPERHLVAGHEDHRLEA